MDSQLFALLRCPRCSGELTDRGKLVECRACQLDFPLIGGIPNLMPDPSKAVAEWRREAQRLAELLERSVGLMDEQLKYPDLLPSTRRRVERTRAAHAENGERITTLFREAGLPPDSRAK